VIKLRALVPVAVLVSLIPGAAFADGFFSVGIGTSTGGSLAKSERTYPWQIGVLSHEGWAGFDAEYSAIATPGTAPNLRTVGASLRIGKKFAAWRPYGSVGWAAIGTVSQTSDVFKITGPSNVSNTLITFGGGVIGSLAKHLGIQVDVREFRDVKSTAGTTRIEFTRAAASVVLIF